VEWGSLLVVYRQCAVADTDFWESDKTVIPSKHNQAIGISVIVIGSGVIVIGGNIGATKITSIAELKVPVTVIAATKSSAEVREPTVALSR
jgi:hypothetical protein